MTQDETYALPKLKQKVGRATAEAAQQLRRILPEGTDRQLLEAIEDELTRDAKGSEPAPERWIDEQAALLLSHLATITPQSHQWGTIVPTLRLDLQGWIRAHPNNAKKVIACLDIIPPAGITIERALSDVGKQKRVFYAQWRAFSDGPSRPIVLKWVSNPAEQDVDTTEDVAGILERELIAHPLSNVHPNIIGTHLLKNDKHENFLVEKRIYALRNEWRSDGIDECANLLYGIAMALSYIHGHDLVHGDIKPDNVGIDENRYILLDFGICRRQERFSGDEPTGSIRTRAPELLDGRVKNSKKSDIWALGATVFNATSVGRFPLYTEDGQTPSAKEARISLARQMSDRAQHEWSTLVSDELRKIPEPLQTVLRRVLDRDPGKRPSATELVQICESELAAYVRIQENNSVFSRIQEANNIVRYMSRHIDALRLMPRSQKRILRDILKNCSFKPEPADAHFYGELTKILDQVDKS